MKITLCGSTRFMEQYHAWNKWLALQGHVVYSVSTSVKGEWQPTDEEKETLDLVHLRKILESDAILVINCTLLPNEQRLKQGGPPETYEGESTMREVKWARILDKQVHYTSYLSGRSILLKGGVR